MIRERAAQWKEAYDMEGFGEYQPVRPQGSGWGCKNISFFILLLVTVSSFCGCVHTLLELKRCREGTDILPLHNETMMDIDEELLICLRDQEEKESWKKELVREIRKMKRVDGGRPPNPKGHHVPQDEEGDNPSNEEGDAPSNEEEAAPPNEDGNVASKEEEDP